MEGTCKVLTVDEIVEINREQIREFGGWFNEMDSNLLNPGSLECVLDEVQGSLFGYELHPSIFEKGAILCWRIIVGHIFHDGNKRTGIEVCRALLELNGYNMRVDMEVVDMALKIATHRVEYVEFVEWVKERTIPISDP